MINERHMVTMNDSYLFRGKTKPNRFEMYKGNELQSWIVGGLMKSKRSHDGVNSEGLFMGCLNEFAEVVPDTIGRCTGLKDKHGKLIFERDIVQDDCSWIKGHRIFAVKYSEHFKRLHLIPKEAYPQVSEFMLKNGIHIFDWTFPYMSLTVIGNIHDNPELLKKCEDNS